MAQELGTTMAARGIRLIYGGSHLGLMGILADAVLAGGGMVTGIVPELLVEKEAAYRDLTDLRIVGSMHERKALMATLSDAFIAMPGGYGTLDELCEMLTWAQIGMHTKPVVLLNTKSYFTLLLDFFDSAVAEGFLRASHRQMLQVAPDVTSALSCVANRVEVNEAKWFG